MILISDLATESVARLFRRYRLPIEWVPDGHSIRGTFWGEPEAGIVRGCVFARGDTPLHSLLHEMSHVICMKSERRRRVVGDAGSDDLEESAVCYLQIVLGDELPEASRFRVMRDMDKWGYSFRLGSSRRWFEQDAEDAASWLFTRGLLDADGRPTFCMRQD